VALTEALVGTMLAVTLYAIAVRSSLVIHLGVLEGESTQVEENRHFSQLMDELRIIFGKHYLRLELISYTNMQALHQALMDQEVHATCTRFAITPLSSPLVEKTISLPEVQGGLEWGQSQISHQDLVVNDNEKQPYQTAIRVKRIYEIMQTELTSPMTTLTYVSTTDLGEKHT
jgi:putative multicomponent Na+:H+ antiporter subunit B